MKYCQEITEMIERASVQRLTLSDKIAMRIHLLMCKPCKRYSEDSKALDTLLTKKFKRVDDYTFSKIEKTELKNKF